MLPACDPIVAETAQALGENARGKVGEALAIGEDEESAIVGDEKEPASALAGRPPDALVATLQVEGGGAEGQKGHPLAVELGNVAEMLPYERGAMEVVAFLEELVEAFPFILA